MYFLSTSSAGGSSSTAKQLIFFSGIGKSFFCFNYFVFCNNFFLKQDLHIYRKHIFRLTNIQLMLTWIKQLQSLFYIKQSNSFILLTYISQRRFTITQF